MRVEQLQSAQTMQDIDLVVRDLRAPGPAAPATIAPLPGIPTGQQPPPGVPTAGAQPWPLGNYGPASHEPVDVATVGGKSGGGGSGGIHSARGVVSVGGPPP